GMTLLPLPGHTPGHAGFRLESRGEVLYHVGDIVHAPVVQVADPLHINTRGAAFLAAVGLGYLNIDEIEALTPTARIYEPQPHLASLYTELFEQFVELYHKTHGLYRRLNHSQKSEHRP
ncbi:MAG: hypothetical protein ACK4SA_13195, partial [Caldilinea sp.]